MLKTRQEVAPGSWFMYMQGIGLDARVLHMAINEASFHLEYPGNPKLPLSVSVYQGRRRLGKIPLGVIMAISNLEMVEEMDVEIFEEEVCQIGQLDSGDVVLHDGFKEAIVVSNQSLGGLSASICFRTSDGNIVASGHAYKVVKTTIEARPK